MRTYSDPTRASNPHALPDVEVFHVSSETFTDSLLSKDGTWMAERMHEECDGDLDPERIQLEADALAGWYWWTCLPGCLPDSDAFGPFKTQAAAIADAQADADAPEPEDETPGDHAGDISEDEDRATQY